MYSYSYINDIICAISYQLTFLFDFYQLWYAQYINNIQNSQFDFDANKFKVWWWINKMTLCLHVSTYNNLIAKKNASRHDEKNKLNSNFIFSNRWPLSMTEGKNMPNWISFSKVWIQARFILLHNFTFFFFFFFFQSLRVPIYYFDEFRYYLLFS